MELTKKRIYTIYLAVIATMISLLVKSKPFLIWLKWGEIGTTFTTMFISFWSYTLLYPWKFSSILILLIFIHEIGHVLAAKYRGLHVTAPTFIPFLGAFVITKNTKPSLEKRAFISIGGPIIGGISGIIFFLFGQQLATDWLSSAALLFILVNLVNSFPLYPMDGY
ncbi:site-2 protease family protein [Neobacillus sp. OS1-2]|uniref:site-2 protease family protein n=1 Tax=Neobacillus sp. OS1-2 TaxID=3070680 RepID=UPI0027E005D4|nr:site-2 protease family protein [Neobacillus sp. OS1-2]WML41618.1 site-2 protease family protein [Neobacillus sp. OS1-2]